MSRFCQTTARRTPLFGITLGLVAIGVLASSPALAQDDNEIFEEIVVFATKRAQDILEVPVAVSTMSGAQIEEAGIKDVWDLQQNVPGLLMGRSQTTTSSNFNIRSIGSTSNNFGVESSVGLYVDGVYRSRQSSMINDLIDVEAVEVLRGPQGTLFGKNTAAGAVSIRSVRPSQDRDAFLEVTGGDFGLFKLSAATNFSLNDQWAARATIFGTERDGFVDDTSLGNDLYNDRSRMGGRLQLAFNEPTDDFNVRIIADYSEVDESCCIGMPRVDSLIYKGGLPLILGALGTQDPQIIGAAVGQTAGSDFLNAQFGGTVFATHNYAPGLVPFLNSLAPAGTIIEGAAWEDYRTALNMAPVSENEDMGLSVEFNKRLSNSITLKSISAFRAFETFDDIDADFSDVDIVRRTNTADQSSFSQEFQLTGEFGQGSTWVAGAYYFGQDLDSTTRTSAGSDLNAFAKFRSGTDDQGVTNIDLVLNGIDDLDQTLDFLAANNLLPPELAFLPGIVNPSAQPFPADSSAFDMVAQEHSGYAVFGQVDFMLSDKFMLTLGGRYTDETKDIDAVYEQTVPAGLSAAITTRDSLLTAGAALADAGAFLATNGAVGSLDGLIAGALVPYSQPYNAWGFYEFDPFRPRSNVIDTLEDDQTTGTAKLTVFPNESTMFYLSYATGFKAGGTNTDRIREGEGFDQIFQAETSESLEFGLKGRFRNVQYAATFYQTDFEDFQANSFFGGGFNLQNAGDLEIEGIELEFVWRPTDSTEVQGWYARNEGKYLDFVSGTEWDTWVVQFGDFMDPPVGDPGCEAAEAAGIPLFADQCPRTGEKLPWNPENRYFLSVTQDIELGSSLSAFARLEYSYGSETLTDGDNDPLTLEDEYRIVNARIGFNLENINSTLTLWGRNITDERYYYGSFDVPLSEDKMMSYPSEPRTWGVTFRKYFD